MPQKYRSPAGSYAQSQQSPANSAYDSDRGAMPAVDNYPAPPSTEMSYSATQAMPMGHWPLCSGDGMHYAGNGDTPGHTQYAQEPGYSAQGGPSFLEYSCVQWPDDVEFAYDPNTYPLPSVSPADHAVSNNVDYGSGALNIIVPVQNVPVDWSYLPAPGMSGFEQPLPQDHPIVNNSGIFLSPYCSSTAANHQICPAPEAVPTNPTVALGSGGDGKKRGKKSTRCDPNAKAGRKEKTGHITMDKCTVSDRDRPGMMRFGQTNRVRKRFNESERKETAEARRLGLKCIRCEQMSQRCDRHIQNQYSLCSSCAKPKNPERSVLFCFPTSIVLDAVFHRPGPCDSNPLKNGRWTPWETEIASGGPIWNIRLWQRETASSGRRPPTLHVSIAEFAPQKGDVTSYEYKDASGKTQKIKMHPFCLIKLGVTNGEFKRYLDDSRDRYLDLLQGKDRDSLIWRIVEKAKTMADSEGNKHMAKVLRFWVACRLIESTWEICEDDLTLHRIPHIKKLQGNHFWNGKIPVTPMMDRQLDAIVIKTILDPLKEEVLHRLENLMRNGTQLNWVEIFVTMTILLTHISFASAHGRRFAILHKRNTRYFNMDLAGRWFHSARMLVCRFHSVCHGTDPLRQDWDEETKVQSLTLTEKDIKFIRDIQKKAREVESLKLSAQLMKGHKYEDQRFWFFQLLTDSWEVGSLGIEPPTACDTFGDT